MHLLNIIMAVLFALVASAFAIPVTDMTNTDLATLPDAGNVALNLTERGLASFDPSGVWWEYGFLRQKFYIEDVLDCGAISGWFSFNQLDSLPHGNDENLQCWATPQPGFVTPLQFDISSFNDDPGRLAMACALSSILGANGNPAQFCSEPSTHSFCCTNGSPS
ncbi:hypothetical protein LTR91_010882 [Friedmanniomyces endolithicus]|uniref:Uncharacterized protein n=1 Tax=Friedmanniomyces endolithicus TaxID=329885 RepID=A0AAN6QT23_9PEZI|nr:hypothetical protein LTR94_020127 [Friedmanniomyces endolithicus]KAK0774099.1 hypothetical protein LTR38_016325 [Friedmanniomyces endolithicus]KAK0787503.1 hypothetical protein LTR75_012887 [Friedmanniomyces endolithicus]KAK0798259.1 hypothetical protein LTR59_006571 [Friedmanniomyces endolithicus]KAK0848502.1 hypothetical protein LTS02_014068 [Friedmanniomyces endolithicus]